MIRRTIDVVIPIADAIFPYPPPLLRISITATSLSGGAFLMTAFQ
jgi:hypothetical protein|tara:strand:- start:468 stop:602 length:135 start_codon:yes stop_codon:yes gene_type:complete